MGRLVGAALLVVGIGVFGYIAGFMASLLGDDEEIYATLLLVNARLGRIEDALAVGDTVGAIAAAESPANTTS